METVNEGNIRCTVDGKFIYVNQTNSSGYLKLPIEEFDDLVKAITYFTK